VWDTGPGIAADQQTLIFKEFQRLAATSASVHGLGLGLSIVERIAKVLDHRIAVVSRVGHGSVFAATMPRAVPGVQRAGTTAEARAALTAPLGRLCVLCIDNDAVILEGMRTLLSTWKCDVLTADSSRVATEVLRKSARRPDVILADYHLDDETGVAAIDVVRAMTARAIPAIVITADQSLEVQRLLREAGHVYLRKPVKVAALRAALTQIDVLQRAQAAE
jgi:CheY-like chemotaxis protein